MLHVDILTAYLICGVSSLVGAAVLRMVEDSEPRLREGLRSCVWSFLVLFVGLLPCGLGPDAAHPAAQWSMTASSLAGVALLGQGLGQMHGQGMAAGSTIGLLLVCLVLPAAAMPFGARVFGVAYATALAGVGTFVVWAARGFVLRARDLGERALGLTLLSIAVAGWVRLAFTLGYEGPVRVHLMYVPDLLGTVLALFYGFVPLLVSTLIVHMVNARLRQRLRARALTDELTGAMSRRALREVAPQLIEAERAKGHDVTVLMLDLDHFKGVNDRHGHAVGDAVLQMAAAALQSHLRPDALLARYGGEEFVAVLPVDGLPVARGIAERLRLAVKDAGWKARLQLEENITVSVGAALAGPDEAFDAVLRRADEALYRAKREGRDQCQFSLMVA